jgi:hypothetical protein
MFCGGLYIVRQPISISLKSLLLTSFFICLLLTTALAQQLPADLPIMESAKEIKTTSLAAPRTALGKDLYCAGFISPTEMKSDMRIIGSEEENRVVYYSQGTNVYFEIGAQTVRPEMIFSIVRPMGDFKHPFTKDKKSLGTFTQELGVLRVLAVQGKVATARIIFSCDDIKHGDLLVPFQERQAPMTDFKDPLPRYQQTSGQKAGSIVMQREHHEMISPRDVVYIDLGSDSGVGVGDKFTIYRQTPKDGNFVRFRDDNVTTQRNSDFGSDKFKGGVDSNDKSYQWRQDVENTRAEIPKKIVGELVVIAVKGKASTAIVTRTTQEVHNGDTIEILK